MSGLPQSNGPLLINCPNNSLKMSNSTMDWLEESYIALTMITSSLSVMGSILIIYFYYTVPSLKTASKKLLVYLSVSDLGIAIGNIIGAVWLQAKHQSYPHQAEQLNGEVQYICQFQAAVSSTFSIASFFWTMFIAWNGYLVVIQGQKALLTNLKWIPHVVSWGVPAITLIVVFSFHRYGFDPCTTMEWWCWIQPDWSSNSTHENSTDVITYSATDMIKWELASGKFWELLSYIFVIIMYTKIRISLNKHIKSLERYRKERTKSEDSKKSSAASVTFANANRKLLFVPAVFIGARIWGTVRFLLNLPPETREFAAYISPLQGVGDSAQGFLNCILFILLTPALREKLLCSHWSVFKRCSKTEEQQDTLRRGEASKADCSENTTHYAGNNYGSIINSEREFTPTVNDDSFESDNGRRLNIHHQA